MYMCSGEHLNFFLTLITMVVSSELIYFKYIVAAFCSALISLIYSLVDMVVIRQYEDQNGSAAMAIISPI